jgi:chromosome segregation ATPase
MKRQFALVLTTALLFGFALSARADKASDIASVKSQIETLENDTPAMLDRLKTLNTEKDNQITFVSQAYDKQEAQLQQDSAAFEQKAGNLKRQYDLLQPALDNYNQRVQAHNDHQCTETNHDGSCGWYTAEKAQLDNNAAQLQQAYAPLDQQKAQLQQDKAYLDQTQEKLETIRTNLNNEIESWKGKVAQLKADWEQHEAQLAQLQAQLAILYGSVNNCMTEVYATNPGCEKPAYGPDGKPITDQNCERMKAECSKMFDGNR